MEATATRLVERLRAAGHEAFFAGGCVRDMLLGKEAHDIDIATSAKPEEVQHLFHRTVAVGAAFGVIVVLEDDFEFQVATFRSDGAYKDGRHPESVSFTTAEGDAKRRDFTVNGLFYDPIEKQIIDHVGGESDLKAGILRSIGNPEERFPKTNCASSAASASAHPSVSRSKRKHGKLFAAWRHKSPSSAPNASATNW